MKNTQKKAYTAATLSLLAFPTDDLMFGSPEADEAFFGDLDSFLADVFDLSKS